MKRALSIGVLVAAAALLVVALPVYAQGGDEDAVAAARGAALFAEFCQACHGPQGEAIAGPASAPIETDEEASRAVLEHGFAREEGGFMPAYAPVLDDEGVKDLLAYMATWGTGNTPALPEPNLHGEEETLAGAVLYAKTCYGCHAAQGKGRDAKGFPAIEWSTDSLDVVREGGELGAGHAFGAAAGGSLDDEQLAALDAYARTWVNAEHAEEPEDDSIAGLDVLLIMIGVAAILVVGGAYATSIIRTES